MCSKYCIGAFVLLVVAFVIFITVVCIKYRKVILRYIIKHHIIRFLANILFPFAIPFALTFAIEKKLSFADYKGFQKGILIALIIAAIINLIAQFLIWNKERKEANLKMENMASKYAYNNLFEVLFDKNNQLRTAYHNGLKLGMLSDVDIPYDIFNHIRKITWEFCQTISKITDIPTKDLDASFIYRYCYNKDNKNDKDNKDKLKIDYSGWKWITGKGSKFSITLDDFIYEHDSTFHYMIHNNISMLFYNDKEDARKNQQYQMTYKDNSHQQTGSFVVAKVAFSGNDQSLCEGIVMVNSYGKKFLDNIPEYTEEELKHLILDGIFPCYRQLLSNELAMLYFRHQEEQDNIGEDNNNPNSPDSNSSYSIKYTKKTECCIEPTKKKWTEIKSDEEDKT